MFEMTKEERAGFVADATRAYPTLDPLQATIMLALKEARETLEILTLKHERKAGRRENRDK